MRTKSILFTMTLFLVLFMCGQYAVAQGNDVAAKVKSLMSVYRYQDAIQLADMNLSTDSTNVPLLLMKGSSLAALCYYRESLDVLAKALSYDTVNTLVLNEMVDVCKQTGDLAKAITYAGKLIVIDKSNVYYRLQLANLLFKQERYAELIIALMPVFTHDPSHLYVAKILGDAYYNSGHDEQAEYFFQKALSISEYDVIATAKLVNVYIRNNDFGKGLAITGHYLLHDSLNPVILKLDGYLHYLQKDYVPASDQFLKAVRQGEKSKFVFKYLALSYYHQENLEKAYPWFKNAWQADTSDIEMLFYYGVTASRTSRPDTGMLLLNSTLSKLLPSPAFLSLVYSELAEACNNSGKKDSALVFLKKAFEAQPQSGSLAFKIAYQYDYHLRRHKESCEWYRQFLAKANNEEDSKQRGPNEMPMADFARKRLKEINK